MQSSGVKCKPVEFLSPSIHRDLLRMLSEPGADLGASLSIEGYYLNLVYYARQVFPSAEGVVLHWYYPENNRLFPVSHYGFEDPGYLAQPVAPGEGIVGRTFERMKTEAVTEDAPKNGASAGAAYRARAIVSTPIHEGPTCLGVLSLHSSKTVGFAQQDVEWLERYAILATAFYQIVQGYRREIDNRAWAEALANATAVMATSLDPSHVLNAILEQVASVVPARGQDIMLIQGDRAYVAGELGYNVPDLLKVSLPISVSPFWHMYDTGLPFLSHDVRKIADWITVEKMDWVRSYAAVPLKSGEKVIGFLNVVSDKVNQFDDEVIHRLKTFGDHASIALENARLHSELRNALRQETLMRTKMIQNENLVTMGRIISLVAHALNNPLQAIMNSLFLIEQGLPPGSEANEIIAIANTDIERLSNLIIQLRQAYEPVKEVRRRFSLAAVIDNVNSLILPQLPERNIVWHYRTLPAEYMVEGVPGQLMKAFLNIGLNAMEAMEGKCGGDLRLDWRDNTHMHQIGVSVQDSGCGIRAEDLPRIFDPYYSTKDTKIGLGLVVCQEIIKNHDGRIDVQSTPGEGTCFTVWLPLAADITQNTIITAGRRGKHGKGK